MCAKSVEDLIAELKEDEVSVDEFMSKNENFIKKRIIMRGLEESAKPQDIKLAYDVMGITGKDKKILNQDDHNRNKSMKDLTEDVAKIQQRIIERSARDNIQSLLDKKNESTLSISDLYERLESIYSTQPSSESSFQDKKVIKEYLRRYKEEKYRFFVPNYPSEKFINETARPDIFMSLFSAANGVGKTATTANMFANILFPGGNNDYFSHDFYTDFPYPKKFRIVSNEKSIKQEIIPALKEWFPVGRYKTARRGLPFEAYWETDTGWIGDIMTYGQRVESFESVTLGLNWFDEPPPKDVFDATVFRMRLGGKIICTTVPLTDAASLDLQERFSEGERIYFNEGTGEEEVVPNTVAHVKGITEDACMEHGKKNSKGIKGHLTHENIVRMAVSVNEEERKARMSGEITRGANFIFQEFSRKIHVIDAFDVANNDYIIWCSLDPHPKKADAIIWVAIDKNNNYFVIDESLEFYRGTAALASTIQQKEAGLNIVQRVCEPHIVNDKHNEDPTYIEKLGKDYQIWFRKGTAQRDDADAAIIDALHYQRDAMGKPLSSPNLYIFKHCEKTIQQLERYCWTQNRQGTLVKTKKDEDLVEALGRIMIKKPKFSLIQGQPKADVMQPDSAQDPFMKAFEAKRRQKEVSPFSRYGF